jgi:hypothetical protein
VAHSCVGFRRAEPMGFASQTFVSSATAEHRHDVVVATADVDQPPAAGVTYTTASAFAHVHEVTLSAADLRRLAGGETVSVVTSSADMPVSHTHTYELHDAGGRWGAPHELVPERQDWAQPLDPSLNPAGGRPAVEIYNMPAFIATQSPRISPDPRIWTTLYEYVSATPADPSTGFLYPLTADRQPAIILRKTQVEDRDYSRALCGFEVWRLTERSHVGLADQILRHNFRLGLPE